MTMSNEKHVEKFDPEREGTSAKAWLRTVESFSRENNLSEDQTYSFARGKLSGPAKSWLARSKVSSWAEFREAFQDAFPDRELHGVVVMKSHRALERRKKLPNESVDEYINEMAQAGERNNVPEETIVRYIVDGLCDPVLRKAIPYGTRLAQLRKAIGWQAEVGVLVGQYNESQVTVDDFERLADSMELVVLGGENFAGMLQGDARALKTVGNELSALLRRHRTALSCNLSNLGTSRTHRIVVHRKQPVPGDVCVPESPSDPGHKGRAVQTSLIRHLTCDVIQKSSSATFLHAAYYGGPGELELDLSHLNATCHRESPNFLVARPLLAALAGFRYFTVLDFDAGHLQIPVAPGSRHRFAFSTPFGPFEFRRAPKQFANTTIIFNKILIELARKLPTADVVVLQDVLVLPSRDTAEGLQKLSRVLPALGAFGLTADLRRSRFFETQMKLFNWVVQHGKVLSTGLPLEPGPGDRLTLVIKASDGTEAFESLLHRRSTENDTAQTVGRFTGVPPKDGDDRTGPLARHLADSIEHFRQFLLFVPFEVVLDADVTGNSQARRQLLRVQQFDFVLKINSSTD